MLVERRNNVLNQTVIVGRVTCDPKICEADSDNKVTNLTLAVPRSYKNIDGKYDTDFLDVTLWKSIAENTVEYVKKGNLVGVKGRLETEVVDNIKTTRIVAEKVTFLSSKKNEDE